MLQLLENWNHANADKTPLQSTTPFSSTGLSTRIQHIQEGKLTYPCDAISSEHIVKDQGYKVGCKTRYLKTISVWRLMVLNISLFSNDKQGKELKTFVNKRTKELKKDGTPCQTCKRNTSVAITPSDLRVKTVKKRLLSQLLTLIKLNYQWYDFLLSPRIRRDYFTDFPESC